MRHACQVCHFHGLTPTVVYEHLLWKHGAATLCLKCRRPFTQSSALVKHYLDKHLSASSEVRSKILNYTVLSS